MPYYIRAYIPVEPINPEIYETIREAIKERDHIEAMQPENFYEVVKYNEKIEEIDNA